MPTSKHSDAGSCKPRSMCHGMLSTSLPQEGRDEDDAWHTSPEIRDILKQRLVSTSGPNISKDSGPLEYVMTATCEQIVM